jgi:diguanylate cyclase (GGDEF)-like protein
MRISNPRLRRQPLNSLATKIIFVVFLSTFLTALVVSWISVRSTYGFLRGQIDRSFPSLLASTSQSILTWLDEGGSELERLASEPALLRVLERRSPSGAAKHLLDNALQRSAFFDSLVLLDASGEQVAAVTGRSLPPTLETLAGQAVEPGVAAVGAASDAKGDANLVVSIPVVAGRDRILGTLSGVFQRSRLREMLATDDVGASGEIYLVDESGQMQLRSGEAGTERVLLGAEFSGDNLGEVAEYRSHSGERVVGAALPLGALGWTLVVEQPFEEAFEPVFSVMTRVFVIDLCIILLFSFLAHQVTATVVQPIEALSEGARRISQGELDVEIQGAKGSDEIGLLIRTFNDMTRKLLHHRSEIEQVNLKLLSQNEELQRANEVLEQLSITDGLTKLHNHRFFQEHLTREIKRADRSGEPLSLLLLDIDDFKQLNDRFGHVAGDEFLVGLAQVLSQSVRDSDLMARYGGEEFAVLAASTDLAGAVNLGEKIRTTVAESAFIVGDSMRPMRMTISIGVAQYRGSRRRMFRAADRALYRAKGEGKNCVEPEDVDAADTGPGVIARDT